MPGSSSTASSVGVDAGRVAVVPVAVGREYKTPPGAGKPIRYRSMMKLL